MENIVILTKTVTRFSNISSSLWNLSGRYLKTSNSFLPVNRLAKFKRNNFFQIFFHDIDLLIIDYGIVIGKDLEENNLILLDKIKALNVIGKKTKVLVLVNNNLEKDLRPFETFVFTENAKGEDFMDSLFEKVKEVLLK